MEETKYYTPSIEEFHVGFEFEFSGVDNYWNRQPYTKQKVLLGEDEYFGLYTFSWLKKIYEDKTYPVQDFLRVKFLDRQDVESEGWKTDDKNAQTGEIDGWIYCAITTTKDEYYMNFCPQTNIGIISDIDENLFIGTIQNISEFRKLLKQLGIK